MHQTVIHNTLPPKRPEELKKTSVARPSLTTHDAPETQAEEKISETQRIWNKYKDLATGAAPPPENTDTDKKALPPPDVEKADEAPETAAAQETETNAQPQPEPPVSGLTELLRQYRQNKDNQRQMRTRTLETPQTQDTGN